MLLVDSLLADPQPAGYVLPGPALGAGVVDLQGLQDLQVDNAREGRRPHAGRSRGHGCCWPRPRSPPHDQPGSPCRQGTLTTRRRSILSSPWSCQGASRGIFSPGWHLLPGHELTRRAVGQASGHRAAAAGQPRVPGPGDQPACAHRPGRYHRLHPDVLWADEAVALLGALAGGGRVATDPLAAQKVARSCADLPLALRIAGARLASRPRWQVSALADRLADT